MDQILFFNIDILAKFLSGSKFNLDNVMYIFRIVTEFRKTEVSFTYQLENVRTLPYALMQWLILNALWIANIH